MKKSNTIIYRLEQLSSVVQDIKKLIKGKSVIALTGDLGAGKTTMVRMLLQSYGVEQAVTSPTFSYLNLYRNDEGITFCHFDLYRIDTLDDFVQAGFAEYLYQPNTICFIEWPTVIEELLSEHDTMHIRIDFHNDMNERKLTITE